MINCSDSSKLIKGKIWLAGIGYSILQIMTALCAVVLNTPTVYMDNYLMMFKPIILIKNIDPGILAGV